MIKVLLACAFTVLTSGAFAAPTIKSAADCKVTKSDVPVVIEGTAKSGLEALKQMEAMMENANTLIADIIDQADNVLGSNITLSTTVDSVVSNDDCVGSSYADVVQRCAASVSVMTCQSYCEQRWVGADCR